MGRKSEKCTKKQKYSEEKEKVRKREKCDPEKYESEDSSDEEEDFHDDHKKDDGKLSFCWVLFYILSAASAYFLAHHKWSEMPEPIKLQDDMKFATRFNAEGAQTYLKGLTDIGPRVGGSYQNEVMAIEYLKTVIGQIISKSNKAHRIEVEVQRGYGNFTMDQQRYQYYPGTCVFRGIQNIVVKVTPADSKTDPDNYLLINSHFDTVPKSPGAGDDATMVAIMLEALRKLTSQSKTFRHGLVFLFNGFEENYLQGSYAFMSGHRWFKKVRMVLNLEGAASGGKDTMVQAGPNFPFLLDYYKNEVSSPLSSVIYEELFQFGIISSATDFEMFTKFGKIPGLDIAMGFWGYLYHTKYDTYDSVPLSTFQQVGDNLLKLGTAFANAKELDSITSYKGEQSIYFDFINLFVVNYPVSYGVLVQKGLVAVGIAVLLLSFIVVCQSHECSISRGIAELIISGIVQVISIAAGAGMSIGIAIGMNMIGKSMTWFSSTYLIIGLYYCPLFLGLCLGPLLYIRYRKIKSMNTQTRVIFFLHAQSMVHITILTFLTLQGLRFAYIFTITTFIYTASSIVNIMNCFRKYHWIFIHVAAQTVPLLYSFSFSMTLISGFIPTTARGDSEANPDMNVALISVLTGFLMFGFIAPLLALVRKPFYIISFIAIVAIACGGAALKSPLGFPFRPETTPQRYYLFHVDRIFYDIKGDVRKADSKVFIQPSDRYTPQTIMAIPEMQKATPLGDECSKELYCAVPFYKNTNHKQHKTSYWLPFSKPYLPTPVALTFKRRELLPNKISTRFHFTVKGTDHMGFYISPVADCKLIAWSFTPKIPRSGVQWNGQDVHYVNYVYGVDNSEFSFNIDIEHPPDRPQEEPTFYLTVVGQYMHHEEYQTEDFKNFINKFPKFTHVIAYQSHLENHVF